MSVHRAHVVAYFGVFYCRLLLALPRPVPPPLLPLLVVPPLSPSLLLLTSLTATFNILSKWQNNKTPKIILRCSPEVDSLRYAVGRKNNNTSEDGSRYAEDEE